MKHIMNNLAWIISNLPSMPLHNQCFLTMPYTYQPDVRTLMLGSSQLSLHLGNFAALELGGDMICLKYSKTIMHTMYYMYYLY